MQQRRRWWRWMGVVGVVVAVVGMAAACGVEAPGGGEGAGGGEPVEAQPAARASGPAAGGQAMPAALRAAYIEAVQAGAPAAYEVREARERHAVGESEAGLRAENPAQLRA